MTLLELLDNAAIAATEGDIDTFCELHDELDVLLISNEEKNQCRTVLAVLSNLLDD